MARPRGSGIKVVRRVLADGTVREHRYLRRPTVPHPEGPAPGTMEALCVAYLKSVKFSVLAPATREQYGLTIERIRCDWGQVAIRDIKPPNVQEIKDTWKDQPGRANTMLAVLSVLFNFGIRRGLCETNPAANPGRLPRTPRKQIWMQDEEQRVVAAFRPSLKLAFYLLLYTLQRPSDVLDMYRSRVTSRGGRLYIALKQHKTNALVEVPVHTRLQPLLESRLAEIGPDGLLVASPRGRRWMRRNFSRAWDHDLRRANLRLARQLFVQGWSKDAVRQELAERHRQRRDLRRTGIVRLAEAGATTAQIAAISGHSIDYCQRIIDTYLPRRTEVALGGIEAWESGRTARVAYLDIKKG